MKYYHFTSLTLRNGEPIPPIGEWLIHTEEIVHCVSGLHASPTPFDALNYAPGCLLHEVELSGIIIPHGNPVNKLVAEKRKITATINASELCLHFACDCALDVIHLWEAPEIVFTFLKTRDKKTAATIYAATYSAAAAIYGAAAAYAATIYATIYAAANAAAYAHKTKKTDKIIEYKNRLNQLVYDNFAKT